MSIENGHALQSPLCFEESNLHPSRKGESSRPDGLVAAGGLWGDEAGKNLASPGKLKKKKRREWERQIHSGIWLRRMSMHETLSKWDMWRTVSSIEAPLSWWQRAQTGTVKVIQNCWYIWFAIGEQENGFDLEMSIHLLFQLFVSVFIWCSSPTLMNLIKCIFTTVFSFNQMPVHQCPYKGKIQLGRDTILDQNRKPQQLLKYEYQDLI